MKSSFDNEFVMWLFDPANESAAVKWRAKWFHPTARLHREWIGWRKPMAHQPANTLLRGQAAQSAVDTFILNTRYVERIERQLQRSSPARRAAIEEALTLRLTIHERQAFDAVGEWQAVNPNKPKAQFFSKVASRLKQLEKRGPVDDHPHMQILKKFEAFVKRKKRLPTKDELEHLAEGKVSTSDGSTAERRTFDKRLAAVGLDGLPERKKPTEPR
jgi:hypothetical protein